MKNLVLLLMITLYAMAKEPYYASISKISNEIEMLMLQSGSWKEGCPVPIKDLRYLNMSYTHEDNQSSIGEMIVHKKVAKDVISIFEALYEADFPIESMSLIDVYDGNDTASMLANNTSAFNCRLVPDSKNISRHAYGLAIDINPFVNPFIYKGKIHPKGSEVYVNRELTELGMIKRNDIVYKAFKKYGWKWGGDWHSMKDYQHFFIIK
ncbi:MAG: M15 family metallopeptidase [Epsilonproteobacteria bacterium]|nr:M15 family metallopeptidase [Campylobacterota bacterium]